MPFALMSAARSSGSTSVIIGNTSAIAEKSRPLLRPSRERPNRRRPPCQAPQCTVACPEVRALAHQRLRRFSAFGNRVIEMGRSRLRSPGCDGVVVTALGPAVDIQPGVEFQGVTTACAPPSRQAIAQWREPENSARAKLVRLSNQALRGQSALPRLKTAIRKPKELRSLGLW